MIFEQQTVYCQAPLMPSASFNMAPSSVPSTVAPDSEIDSPQDMQVGSRPLQGLLMHIWTTSDDMPRSGADFFKSIDALPKSFASHETKEQLSKAVADLADVHITNAWQRATSFQLPALWTWKERSLDDWLRLVNYPILNDVFFEAEVRGDIASSSNELWSTEGEQRIPQALDPNGSSLPCPAPRMGVAYGLPYGRNGNPYHLQDYDPARWHPLSWNALNRLREHYSPSFQFSPRSNDSKDGLMFPGIIYVAQASEADICKGGLEAAAAAARALQLMEDLVDTAVLLSSNPVIAVVVSAGPLWRLYFATSTPSSHTGTRYVSACRCKCIRMHAPYSLMPCPVLRQDMYRSRKLELYIDDLGDRLRLFVILGHLERWLREAHAPWIRRHIKSLWQSYLAEHSGDPDAEDSDDMEDADDTGEGDEHTDEEDSDAGDLYIQPSDADRSEAGSSEAGDWDPDSWEVDNELVEDWVEEAQYTGKEAPVPSPW